MGLDDARLTRRVWKEIYKRPVDPTRLLIRTSHGIIYVDGELRPIRGQHIDVKKEWEILEGILRHLAEVRDIAFHAKFIDI